MNDQKRIKGQNDDHRDNNAFATFTTYALEILLGVIVLGFLYYVNVMRDDDPPSATSYEEVAPTSTTSMERFLTPDMERFRLKE